MRCPIRLLLSVVLAVLVASGANALASSTAPASKVYLTVEEALALAFPECEVEHTTVFLTKEQRKEANRLAKLDVETSLVHVYTALREGQLVGRAYFDTHKVRTLKETIMVVVDPRDRIQRLELLAFAEPEDYVPRANWYGQFKGKVLDEELSLDRGIRGVTGATLTARATTNAARRILALHAVIRASSSLDRE